MTLYDDLGVRRSCSDRELRSAYLSRARELHPDRPGGDAAAMARVNHAWEVLSDPKSRIRYDRTLRTHRAHDGGDGTSSQPDRAGGGPGHSVDGASDGALDDTSFDGVEIVDDGRPLGSVLRLMTRLTPLLAAFAFVAFHLGLLLQVQPIMAAGLVAGVGAVVLFVLMPFFAMSARR